MTKLFSEGLELKSRLQGPRIGTPSPDAHARERFVNAVRRKASRWLTDAENEKLEAEAMRVAPDARKVTP